MSETQQKTRRWENQYIALIEQMPDYIIAGRGSALSEEQCAQIRARSVPFAQVVCELGSGSGAHLIACATESPETLFIGFEIRFKRAYRTAQKAEAAGLRNVLVVNAPAQSLASCFPSESLHGVYVNFPDPWSKRRWHKHRLLSPEFLQTISDRLAPGGFLSYKTDHQEYFAEVRNTLQSSPELQLAFVTTDLYEEHPQYQTVKTEFERLFLSQGKPICLLRAEKRGGPGTASL